MNRNFLRKLLLHTCGEYNAPPSAPLRPCPIRVLKLCDAFHTDRRGHEPHPLVSLLQEAVPYLPELQELHLQPDIASKTSDLLNEGDIKRILVRPCI